VHKHSRNLQNKGLLARAHNRSRSLDVLPPRAKGRGVERLRRGRLLPVIRRGRGNSESISLGDIVGNRDVFVLQVRGESMRDEHILDGDYVLWSASIPLVQERSWWRWFEARKPL